MSILSSSLLARSLRLGPSTAASLSTSRPSRLLRPVSKASSLSPAASSSTSRSLLASCSTCRSSPPPRHRQRSFHSSPPRRAKVDEVQYGQIAKIAEARANERLELIASISEDDTQFVAVKKAKRIRVLEPVAELWKEYKGLQEAYAESLPLLKDEDASMREMATLEVADLRTSIATLLSTTIPTQLLPPSSQAELSCIVECKAGAGGDEAALFADEMLLMYKRYAQIQGWRCTVLEEARMGMGGEGLREAKLEIKGQGAYGKLRWESGVHRVQRVPATEKAGRTHTSTMAVMVSPIFENTDAEDLSYVEEKDVKMEFYRSSGAGGQAVNKTESAVRLVHTPTGIVSACQEGRSQHQNRAVAWTMLRAKVYAHRLAIQQAADLLARKGQIPGMDRSDKIRTWNFPQDRVTDHRIPANLSNLPSILAGDGLDDMVYALQEYHLGLRLTAMLSGDEFESDA